MENKNNKKRWFYDLTEKQVFTIVAIFEVIFFIITVILIITNRPTEQLLAQKELNMTTVLMFVIVLLFCSMVALGLFIWMLLWENPKKQSYLFWKEHDEKIVPRVREKFGLTFDFKEVIFKNNSNRISKDSLLHCYAKETEEGIVISLRDKNGEELKSKLIENYNYFDLNYEPKV